MSAQAQPTRTYDFTGGTNAVADNVDTDLNTLYTVLQGGVGDTHIASDAAINHGKILGGLRVSNRQDIAADSTVTDQRMCFGWTYINGDGSSAEKTVAITFPITFTVAPVVVIGALSRLTSNPAAIGDLTDWNSATGAFAFWAAKSITTTGFSAAYKTPTGNDTLNLRSGGAWIAIGTKAN